MVGPIYAQLPTYGGRTAPAGAGVHWDAATGSYIANETVTVGGSSARPTASTPSSSSSSSGGINWNAALPVVNTILTKGVEVALTIFREQNITERNKIHEQAELEALRLRQQLGLTTDPYQQQSLSTQLALLSHFQSAAGGGGVSPTTIILVIAGVAVVVGGAYFLSQRRSKGGRT